MPKHDGHGQRHRRTLGPQQHERPSHHVSVTGQSHASLACFAIRVGVKARAATALARLGLDAGANRTPTMVEAP